MFNNVNLTNFFYYSMIIFKICTKYSRFARNITDKYGHSDTSFIHYSAVRKVYITFTLTITVSFKCKTLQNID